MNDHPPQSQSIHEAPPASSTGGQDAPPATLMEVEQRVVRWWHPLLILALLAGLYLLGDQLGLYGDLEHLRQWIDGWGYLAPAVFVAIYVVVTTLCFPGAVLTAAAGALFGALIGVATSLVASTISAIVSFLIARHLLRDFVMRHIGRSRRFRQVNRLTQHHGPVMVLTVRLINLLPFWVVNYGFGVTHVRFGTYVFWSILGKIPGTIVLVVGVDAVYQALLRGEVPWPLVILVLATTAGLALTVRHLNQRLRADVEAVADEQAGERRAADENADSR